MKTSMLIVVAAVFAVFCPVKSQSGKNYLWALGKENAIELRWLPSLEMPFPIEGYTLLRRRIGGITTFYPLDTIIVRPEINSAASVTPILRDSISALLKRASNGINARSAIEELRLAAAAHPSIFYSLFNFHYLDTTARENIRYDYQLAIGIDVIAQANNIGRDRAAHIEPPPLRAFASGNAIRLSWNTYNALSDGIASWKILRKTASSEETELPNTLLSAFFSDNKNMPYIYEDMGLRKGETYFYRLIANDVFGRESIAGAETSATVESSYYLLPPIGLQASVSGKSVKLTWKKLSRKYGESVGVYLYRQEGKTAVRLTNSPISDTFFIDVPKPSTSLEAAYFVTSVDSKGNESEPSFQRIVTISDEVPPSKPDFVGITPDNRVLTIRWSRSKSIDASFYEVSRSTNEQGDYALITKPIADTIFEDSADEGAAWWYKVRAIDIQGNRSDWTASVFGTIHVKNLPPNPVITSAKSLDRRVLLEWTPIVFPTLAGYWVNRYDDTTFTPITLNAGLLASTTTRYDDTTALPGTLYVYEVVAQDSNLNFSHPSPRAYGRSYDASRPYPPKIDSLVIAELGIVVVWAWETALKMPYEVVVERSTDDKRYVQISPLLQSDESHYPDYTVRAGETYYYRLRARSKRGVWSAPSASQIIDFVR